MAPMVFAGESTAISPASRLLRWRLGADGFFAVVFGADGFFAVVFGADGFCGGIDGNIAGNIDSNIAGKPAPTMAIGGESPTGGRGIA